MSEISDSPHNIIKLAAKNAKSRELFFKFTPVDKLITNVQPHNWLVKNWMECETVGFIFGPSEVGKSFLAIDIAAHLATGKTWLGHRVKHGPVLYVCGEGHSGMARRFSAWQKHHRTLIGGNLCVSECPIDIDTGEGLETLNAAIKVSIEDHLQENPVAIVIDTLAMNYSGEENSSKEMGQFIKNVKKVCSKYKSTAIIIDHTGHADKSRARGSSSKKGNVDFQIGVDRDEESGILTFRHEKMKDAPKMPEEYLKYTIIGLGIFDEDNEEVSSVILESTDERPPPKAGKTPIGSVEQGMLTKLKEMYHRHGQNSDSPRVAEGDWKNESFSAGILKVKNKFYRTRDSLVEKGLVRQDGIFCFPVE